MVDLATLAACCAAAFVGRLMVPTTTDAARRPQGRRDRRRRLGPPRGRPPAGGAVEVRRFHLRTEDKADAAATVAAVGLAAGGLAVPVLGPISAIPLSFIIAPSVWRAVNAARARRFQVDQVMTAIAVACFASGNYLGCAVLGVAGRLRDVLLAATETHFTESLSSSFAAVPRTAWLVHEGREVEVPLGQVRPGDVVAVRAMETIPIDGVVAGGSGEVDQHQFTGEWQPVTAETGRAVFAGTVLQSGLVHIRADRAGADTRAAEIHRLLLKSAHQHLAVQSRGEAIANGLTPLALTAGAVAVPFLGLYRAAALAGAVTCGPVRVIAPILMLQALAAAGRDGVLIKDGRVLEVLQTVDTVVFDKTGTLTTAEPAVGAVHARDPGTEQTVLSLAARAEYRQPHPIARALVAAARDHGCEVCDPGVVVETHPGLGVTAEIAGQRVRVGSRRFLDQAGLPLPAALAPAVARADDHGQSLVFVCRDDAVIGAVELVPNLRPEVPEVVAALTRTGIRCVILSGDHEATTRALATRAGIERWFAEVLPEDKAAIVDRLQADGRTVCFVGDGVNDALALKRAKVSISLHGATDLAIDTAQIVLARADLRLILYCFELVHAFDRHLRRGWAASTVPTGAVIPAVIVLGAGVGALAVGLAGGLAVGLALSTRGLTRSLRALPETRRLAPPDHRRHRTAP